jgi:hypothetical protein
MLPVRYIIPNRGSWQIRSWRWSYCHRGCPVRSRARRSARCGYRPRYRYTFDEFFFSFYPQRASGQREKTPIHTPGIAVEPIVFSGSPEIAEKQEGDHEDQHGDDEDQDGPDCPDAAEDIQIPKGVTAVAVYVCRSAMARLSSAPSRRGRCPLLMSQVHWLWKNVCSRKTPCRRRRGKGGLLSARGVSSRRRGLVFPGRTCPIAGKRRFVFAARYLSDHGIGEFGPADLGMAHGSLARTVSEALRRSTPCSAQWVRLPWPGMGMPISLFSSLKILISDGGGGMPFWYGKAQPMGLARGHDRDPGPAARSSPFRRGWY